jgi:hypothetical protein
MIAGRRSKTVAFVAILALTTSGALATASAQSADIKAIDKAFQDHYARGNYSAAQIESQELERLAKARLDGVGPENSDARAKHARLIQFSNDFSAQQRDSSKPNGAIDCCLAIKHSPHIPQATLGLRTAALILSFRLLRLRRT